MNNNENMIYQNLQAVAKSKHTFIWKQKFIYLEIKMTESN